MQKKQNDVSEKTKVVPNQKLQMLSKRDERRFNALMTQDKDLLSSAVTGGVTYQWFLDDQQRMMFSIIAEYFRNYGTLITYPAFCSIAEVRSATDEAKTHWVNLYNEMQNEHVSPEDYPSLRKGLAGRYMQARVFSVLDEFHPKIINAVDDQLSVVTDFQRQLNNISSPDSQQYTKVSSLEQQLPIVMQELAQRQENPQSFWGLPSGFKCMDNVLYGFQRGTYIVFMGMEGGGKTTLMMNLALNMAKGGCNIVYVTIETGIDGLSKRLLTIHSGISYNRILAGGKGEDGLPKFIMDEFEAAKKELFLGDIAKRFHMIEVLQDTSRTVIEGLINRIRAFCRVDAVFIDYLDVVGKETSHVGRADLELADVSAGFQNYGKKHNILMISAQQLRSEKVRELQKKVTAGADFKVGTGDMSGTKKISAGADGIYGLLIDQRTYDRLYLFSAKARQNKDKLRFTLLIDRDSGRIKDVPDAATFDAVGTAVETDAKLREEVFQKTDVSAKKLDDLGKVDEDEGGKWLLEG